LACRSARSARLFPRCTAYEPVVVVAEDRVTHQQSVYRITMANVKSNITVSGDEELNIYQRLQQIGDELDALENHKDRLSESGYVLQINTDSGVFVAEVQDQ